MQEQISGQILAKEHDLASVAHTVISYLERNTQGEAHVVLLDGELGAGKTTFTQHLAKALGVQEDVTSPTFILKKEYKTSHPTLQRLIHIDAYRFVEPKEAKVLRLENDTKDRGTLMVIEWPSKMTPLPYSVKMLFSCVDDATRQVDISYGKQN
jgi:tRNA threonylcarbamoyladenosine biosynthesis protein TsaE